MPKDFEIPMETVMKNPEFAAMGSELQKLDRDGDGVVDAAEFLMFIEKHQNTKKNVKDLLLAVSILAVVIIVLILVGFGLTFTAIELNKDFTVESDGAVVDGNGDVLYTGEYYDPVSYDLQGFLGLSKDEKTIIQRIVVRTPDTSVRTDISSVEITDEGDASYTLFRSPHGSKIHIDNNGAVTDGADELQEFTNSDAIIQVSFRHERLNEEL
uniref:EF-hand domain-containing protein n=1 Tax=Fibrocapsa japonica TaxID=94617 RepID=A0A7S2XYJ0_9STRA|mmetsp:Transcript_3105/g.4588  ORF Transcript_3105/g.4588 Transcript_3105/m.4588 type:complete len:212 (+) Transcript_3105:264-899(+)|eukprot:CAMPEP_0113936576 /NCGR_PEP_ID=MMETSP1339-20121228/3462_1 /TAXON_ID=94617 /ORGANISM="Fibrocapsa japonica" /LENGTH=211 /DNA_ID=CAMNT_0000939101 /DNA_START=181 /DNA_END=816 /DNA_ORIENTATION=+ /assembly_acc=CAM_ASM_000762